MEELSVGRSVEEDVYGLAEALGYKVAVTRDGSLMMVTLCTGDIELYVATLQSYGHNVSYSASHYVCYVQL